MVLLGRRGVAIAGLLNRPTEQIPATVVPLANRDRLGHALYGNGSFRNHFARVGDGAAVHNRTRVGDGA